MKHLNVYNWQSDPYKDLDGKLENILLSDLETAMEMVKVPIIEVEYEKKTSFHLTFDCRVVGYRDFCSYMKVVYHFLIKKHGCVILLNGKQEGNDGEFYKTGFAILGKEMVNEDVLWVLKRPFSYLGENGLLPHCTWFFNKFKSYEWSQMEYQQLGLYGFLFSWESLKFIIQSHDLFLAYMIGVVVKDNPDLTRKIIMKNSKIREREKYHWLFKKIPIEEIESLIERVIEWKRIEIENHNT